MNSEKIKKETAKLDKKEEELENQLQKELAEALKLKEEIEKEREKALKMAEREKQRQAERERKAKEREKERERLRKEKEKEKEREKKRREREKIKAKEKAKRDKEKAKEKAKLQAQREKEKEKERLRKEKEAAKAKAKGTTAAKPKAKTTKAKPSTTKKRTPSAASRAKSAKAREDLMKKVAEEVAAEETVATPEVTEVVTDTATKTPAEPIVAEASDFTFISKEETAKPAANPFPTSSNKGFKQMEVKQEATFKDALDDEESILEEARLKAGDGDLEDLRRRRLAAQEFLRAKQSEAVKTPKIEPIKIDGIDLGLALEKDDSSVEHLGVDNSEFVEKIEELETVNKELSDKLELLELGSQDLEVKIKELDTINKDFETKVTQLETTNKEVLEKNISLETKYAKLEAKYEALEQLSLGVQSQIDALVKQLELLKNPSAIEPLERKTSNTNTTLIEAELSKKAKLITEYLEAEAEYKEKLTNIEARKDKKLISTSEYEIMKDEILYEIKVLQKERIEYEVKYEALLSELKFVDKDAYAKWEAKGIIKKAIPIVVEKETLKAPKEENKQMFTDKAIVVKDDIQKLENDIKLLSTEFTLTHEKIAEIEEELKKQKNFENELKNSSEAMKEFQSYLFNLNKLILLLENQKVKTLKYKKDLENVAEPLGMKALKLRANIEDSLKEEKSLNDRKEYIENIVKDFDRFEDVRIYKRSLQDRAKMNELLKENKEKLRTIVEQRKSKEKYLSWYKDENKKYL